MIIAMFIAPVLAIVAYFATDHMVAEKPQAATPGHSYPLAAKSNCRYQSGACTLKNGDIEIHLTADRIASNTIRLSLSSQLPIENALIALYLEGQESAPVSMQHTNTDASILEAELHLTDPENTKMRIAVKINQATYFVETSAIFVDLETSFSRENFSS
ncbi:hypothetical protein [Teredinibacter sp. KSP-S5-2]|uniref:hypothetical protein n=1 Tax=Teredinibacter sp. KSP-S5-2 TaxID=3034506 RepID=UPI002934CD36|nr:hypothetical protein [Teredinibacter sp. KSP-S5-2]WNO11102.1 hypothetical protein P5V12_07950 [Teredinibacter sp. KSP-S5-2]